MLSDKLRYVGAGFIPGIPARDLTAEEVQQYGGVKTLIATQLYRREKQPPKKEGKK